MMLQSEIPFELTGSVLRISNVRLLALMAACFSFAGCAHMFNGNIASVRIHTTRPARVAVDADTFMTKNNSILLLIPRSRRSFSFTAIYDSSVQRYNVHRSIAPVYFLNLLSPVFIGFV